MLLGPPQRDLHRGPVVERGDLGEVPRRPRAVRDHGVDDTLDERHREPVGDRRDQADPQRGQPRREHRHRHDEPLEAANLREDLHHGLEAHGLGTDVINAFDVALEGEQQVVEDVAHRDRLDVVEGPLGRDHRRRPLGEVADHLEGGRSRADDRTGSELDRRQFGAQDLADLGAARQVVRHPVGVGKQTAEVDHPFQASGGGGEVPCRRAVALDEAGTAAHQVDEVVGGLDTVERRRQGFRFLDVALHDVHVIGPGPSGDAAPVADHHADVVTLVEQLRHEPTADVTGGAGDQDLHDRSPPGA